MVNQALEWMSQYGWQFWSEAIIVVGLLAMLWLIPAQWQKGVWGLPAAFALINVIYITGLWSWLNAHFPYTLLFLWLVIWITAFTLQLPRQTEPLLRSMLVWNGCRIAIVHLVFASLNGAFPGGLAFELTFSEFMSALGALSLWLFYYPRSGLWRALLLFWNTYALLSVGTTLASIWMAQPHAGSLFRLNPDIFRYFQAFPQYWMQTLFLPVFFAAHFVLFRLAWPRNGEAEEKEVV